MIDGGDADEPAGDLPFARAYDFFKHLTGVALVSIGGVFAFLDGGGVQLDRRRVIIVLVCLGISGAASLMMAATLSGLEVTPVPRDTLKRYVRIGQLASVFPLLVGLGGFVQTFTSAVL